MIRKHITITIVSACLISLSTAALATRETNDWNLFTNHFMTKSVSSIQNHIELLFVENAEHASLKPDVNKKGCMDLDLWPVSSDIHYFTDEPVRLSGNVTPSHFVNMWSKQNKAGGKPFIPNVEIEALSTAKGKAESTYHASAALGEASYNADDKRMHYLACPLKGESPLKTEPNLKKVTIFFDQFTIWPPT